MNIDKDINMDIDALIDTDINNNRVKTQFYIVKFQAAFTYQTQILIQSKQKGT